MQNTLERDSHDENMRILQRNIQSYLVLIWLLFLFAPPAVRAQTGTSYAVLIGGLGGNDEYAATFEKYLFDTRQALVDRFGIPTENIFILTGNEQGASRLGGQVSTSENIQRRFAELAGTVDSTDHVYVFLFGHGSFDGKNSQLNIPRRDLNDTDYAAFLDNLEVERIVFVNTASASGPFVQALAAPDRIIITATRTGTERNETVFPRFLVEALQSPVSDFDKDGRVSLRELFTYATENTARFYEADNHLATEHALIEDSGDGQGIRLEEIEESGEGAFAAVTYLDRYAGGALAGHSGPVATGPRAQEKEALEREIASLIGRKSQMNTDTYYAELEDVFVRLARLNDEIEAE